MDETLIEGYDVSDTGIFSSSNLYDAARRLGMNIGMAKLLPLGSGRRLVARAHTLKFAPPGSAGQAKMNFYDVIAAAPKASALVIEAGVDRWLCGSNTTRFAELSGMAGMVIDACVRDIAAIGGRGYPVFARGAAVTGYSGDLVMATAGETIKCAGVTVSLGDLIVGDEDGLVCVPAARLADVLFQAEEIAQLDAQLERDIEMRKPLSVLHETRVRWSIMRPA